jgi:hypothetical protein
MKKGKLFILGMLAAALTFGLVLVGCPDGGSSFDGATLAGTKWIATQTNVSIMGALTVDIKATLEFSADTAGTATFEITKWSEGWSEELKSKMQASMTEDNGPFTSTYDNTAKTGTYTLKSGTPGTFTVDAGKKQLTTTEVEDGETRTGNYKLQ